MYLSCRVEVGTRRLQDHTFSLPRPVVPDTGLEMT